MKERPIIFNTTMVKAIVEGRKTQTRRILKKQPPEYLTRHCWYSTSTYGFTDQPSPAFKWWKIKSPFGQVGDQIWVRETFCMGTIEEEDHYLGYPKPLYVHQDGDPKQYPIYKEWCLREGISFEDVQWLSPFHMARSACRLVLEITNIRVEKLLSISEQDCMKEGIGSPLLRNCKKPKFMQSWEEIYGEGACLDNPWVWVIEFKVVQGGET